MSILKKTCAVGLGLASLAGGAIALAAKEALNKAGERAGKDGITDSRGRTFRKSDYDGFAKKCDDDLFKRGVKKAIELWQDED